MESLLISSSSSLTTSPIFSSSKHALTPKPQSLSFNSNARLVLFTCAAQQMNSPPSTAATTAEKEVKLWGGRFEESVTDAVEKFTESISFDKALYKQDIMGSKAHASMLAKQVNLYVFRFWVLPRLVLFIKGFSYIYKQSVLAV